MIIYSNIFIYVCMYVCVTVEVPKIENTTQFRKKHIMYRIMAYVCITHLFRYVLLLFVLVSYLMCWRMKQRMKLSSKNYIHYLCLNYISTGDLNERFIRFNRSSYWFLCYAYCIECSELRLGTIIKVLFFLLGIYYKT